MGGRRCSGVRRGGFRGVRIIKGAWAGQVGLGVVSDVVWDGEGGDFLG